MAESIVGGLFGINPAMYQQQQQQQVLKNAIAMQQLDPFQRAGVGLQQAGYNFAGALGGVMGGVDPQLQRISALNAISKQIDQSNPESMMEGAKMLADAGFQQEAFGLAEYARKANSELALAQQRMRADKAAAPETTNEIKNATASANLSGFEKGTPEYNKVFKDELARLTTKPDKENLTTNEIRNATAIADASGFTKGTPEYNNAYKEALTSLTAKPLPPTKDKKVSEFGQLLQEAGLDPESQEYKDQVKAFAKLKLEKPNADKAPPSVGGDAERISQRLYGKRFSELTQAEAAIVDAEVEKRDLAGKKASAPSTVTNVNAFTPASVTAQQDFIKAATEERKALRNAPDTLKNIEAAKKLIPTASTFMGTGGEPLLAAASFLNNRLGFSIATKGVTDATVLRTRLFEGILDNLKKLDSQPSQEQQRVLAEALGNLGTDPAALEQILDRIGETVSARVERFNTDVTEAEGRGVKFPFKPQIALPMAKPKAADGAALIPTGKSATTVKPMYATNGKERIMSTDGGKTWSPVR